MEYEQLDDYSKGFLEYIINEFPAYKQYVKVKKYNEEEQDTYLFIDVPCPSDEENSLWISTYGDEITVGYDYFHSHYGYNDSDEEDYIEAIEIIKDIVNEVIITITGSKEGKWTFSYFIKPEDRASLKVCYDNYDTLNIKSWKGTFNEIINI